MFFRDITGQDEIKEILRESADSGRIAHAQLLSGRTGYGSLALPLAYARYINCEDRVDGDSCGVCKSCYTMNGLTHPNLHFIFPSNKTKSAESFYSDGGTAKVTSDSYISAWRNTVLSTGGYFTEYEWYKAIGMGDTSKNVSGMIGRADAKNLIEKLQYKSIGKGYKVVIIWLPERMNSEAANTLLKEFEEPEKETLFLFVSENSSAILPTVLSRTQQITVPPIDNLSMEKYAATQGIERAVALLAEGDRNILRSAEGESESDVVETFRDLMSYCYLDNYPKLSDWCNDFSTFNREEMKYFFRESLRILRVCYMRSIGMNDIAVAAPSEGKFITNFHPYINDTNIEAIINDFEKCYLDISRNGNNKAVMSHFTLSLCKNISKKNLR